MFDCNLQIWKDSCGQRKGSLLCDVVISPGLRVYLTCNSVLSHLQPGLKKVEKEVLRKELSFGARIKRGSSKELDFLKLFTYGGGCGRPAYIIRVVCIIRRCLYCRVYYRSLQPALG